MAASSSATAPELRRRHVSSASQAVLGNGDPISVTHKDDNVRTDRKKTVKNISTRTWDENVLEDILNRVKDPTDLPLELLRDITDNFSEERKIGQGGFGAVYKGVLGTRSVAVKRIDVNVYTVDDKSFRREVTSLMEVNHDNVVRFLGFCSNTLGKSIKDPDSGQNVLVSVKERLLCLEYISNGSLDRHITDELRGLEWEMRYEIITGICEGLLYLHEEKDIIHMDLKPANILLAGKSMVPKITDFGLSRPSENSHTVGLCFGTPGYLAPEYRGDSKTTSACDIYNLGVMVTELVTGRKEIPDENNVIRRWRHRWKKPPTQLQYQQVTRCIHIAKRCREQKPEARPSILNIISLLSESESRDGHTCQQESNYLDDDMLGIEPLELHFTFQLNMEMSWLVKLTNKTKACFAFHVKIPSKQYTIQPDKGIVQPECNEYLVHITMRPQERAPQATQNADKFVVQSTTVSDGHRVEDITENIFHAKAGKIVDEVNVMVVYEPTKLGSSGKAQAASLDLNSSARGQCTEQTKHWKFYPPQSFSRHSPTNTKYLGRESDRAVDLVRGALGSLLDKLGKLVTEDYNLKKSIKSDIESFSEDLTIMHRDLPKLEKIDGAKILVDEVRELSYYIEDMVDSFLVHIEPDSNGSGFRELTHEGLKLWENGMMTHHQIVDVIRDLKNQVQAVVLRKEKYKFEVNNVVADATAKADIDDIRNSAIYEDKEELIGIEIPRDELIRLFEEDGDVAKKNLKIISIVGQGGLGKTTLAKAVYDKIRAQYHTRAFVPVGRNPDVKEVLRNIIFEFEMDFNAANMTVHQLIKKLSSLLENKRYFIIIDDIWDSLDWKGIRSAFPSNKRGSRVITTTRIRHVALACCNSESKYVYRIKPLREEESKRLFFRRIFGSKEACPDTLKHISVDILKRCGGMPLAINSIASLLAGEPETTWEYVRKSLGTLTEGNAALDNMKQILNLSYIHLPDHLKTCLLYVCMYPEDREIDKNDLMRQWIAEGFVQKSTNSRLDAEDVAENYFKMLISMCMIQPGKIDYNDEVLSCTVHDIILDVIRSKSSEVNFAHVIDGSKDETGEHRKIHRVSVHSYDEEDSTIFETMKNKDPLKHVRSVILYRGSLVPYFLEFNYVRVLHLEYDWGKALGPVKKYIDGFSSRTLDLTGISRLFHLRYLKIACSGRTFCHVRLPDQIGALQQLETIDLQRCLLEKYPTGIDSLPRLSHLRHDVAKAGPALPDGIGRMKSLHTLRGVSLMSSVHNIKGLGQLTNLRNLELHLFVIGKKKTIDEHMEAVHSSISRLLPRLTILSLRSNIFLGKQPWDLSDWSRTLFSHGCDIRKLDLRGQNFHRCPKWIGQLHDLSSLRIQVRELADGLSIVAGLPSLAYFCLLIENGSREEKEERAFFSGSGSFRALKHLRFRCKNASLTFEKGALPKLEKLEILFRRDITLKVLPIGIEHLPAGTLKEIILSVNEKMETSSDRSMLNRYDVLSLDQSGDKIIEHKKELRLVLKRAFKVHHPGAEIVIHFERGVDEDFDVVEYAPDDEEDHEEDDDQGNNALLVNAAGHYTELNEDVQPRCINCSIS